MLVQRQLVPSAAGVAFSADPVSGREDRIVISAVAGLADSLVAGEADGDTYHVDAASKAVTETALQGEVPGTVG